ncbi:MAG: homoserine O-acetyltransferase [Acidobacteria bacterium]|nr:MAG: homoserine O-acetyltransferase [Acidobacteriota bacterium]
MQQPGVGTTKTEFFTFAHPPNELQLESGQKLGPITLAYETYGLLNKDKTNAILLLHSSTGDANAAGFHEGRNEHGWWDNMVGPGKAFDTRHFFVICSNVLGGCAGSTGPSSINPQTGKSYALEFPVITIADMVNAQRHLIDFLGIEKLLCIAGGQMGGMQVLQWAAAYSKRVRSAIPIATTLRHSPQQMAFNEVTRQAITADPEWRKGYYYGLGRPETGLAVCRMILNITQMSDRVMEEKFSRRVKEPGERGFFTDDFEVEGCTRYRNDRFVKSFDANSYLFLTKAMDQFDLSRGKLFASGRPIQTRFMVVGYLSDWLYPPYQSLEIARELKARKTDATYCEINSKYGHNAYLMSVEEQTHLIRHFVQTDIFW